MPGQTCPRCSVSTISPRTGKCELCGFAPGSSVAVVAEDVVSAAAVRELAHEFEFGELLGLGKGSAVYRVRERTGGRSAILKVAARRTDAPDAEESFRAMLGVFAGFEHPHLVPVLRYGSTDSLFWYTTEDLGGTTLRALLDDRGALDARTCRRIATQVVAALDYLHRHGVVHGALKVDNVLLDKEGWVRVCDPSFLRARWKRRSRSTPTRGITSVGGGDSNPRASWVAPEDHERGERLPAADQYALGALLYECVSGHPPEHPLEPLQTVAGGLPPQMARAIETAMSREPFRRFASLSEFLFALEARTSSSITPVVAPAPRPSERMSHEVMMIRDWEPPAAKRNLAVLIGRGAIVVAIIAAAVWTAAALLDRETPTGASVVSTGAPSAIPSDPRPPAASVAPPPRTSPRAVPPTQVPTSSPTSSPTPTLAPAPPRAAARPSEGAPVSATPETPPPVVTTGEPGRLFVNASPWGSVTLDGIVLGNTPRANIEVTPGQHTLRISRPGFETVERVIRVQPGETVRLTDIVLVPTRP